MKFANPFYCVGLSMAQGRCQKTIVIVMRFCGTTRGGYYSTKKKKPLVCDRNNIRRLRNATAGSAPLPASAASVRHGRAAGSVKKQSSVFFPQTTGIHMLLCPIIVDGRRCCCCCRVCFFVFAKIGRNFSEPNHEKKLQIPPKRVERKNGRVRRGE